MLIKKLSSFFLLHWSDSVIDVNTHTRRLKATSVFHVETFSQHLKTLYDNETCRCWATTQDSHRRAGSRSKAKSWSNALALPTLKCFRKQPGHTSIIELYNRTALKRVTNSYGKSNYATMAATEPPLPSQLKILPPTFWTPNCKILIAPSISACTEEASTHRTLVTIYPSACRPDLHRLVSYSFFLYRTVKPCPFSNSSAFQGEDKD